MRFQATESQLEPRAIWKADLLYFGEMIDENGWFVLKYTGEKNGWFVLNTIVSSKWTTTHIIYVYFVDKHTKP